MIRSLAVVIPARDEEQLIGACLESVLTARRVARLAVDVDIVVVADGCLDRTVEIARGFDGVTVLEVESSNVGAARAVGADWAIARGAQWIANTDADSVVPPNWVIEQLAAADTGSDLVIGTVRPDFRDLDPAQRAAWQRTHRPGRPNGHVHGANLGIRVARYVDVGGYRPLPEHEDADLVARLVAAGASTIASDASEVMTSGRRVGRTPGGYARYLRDDLLVASAVPDVAV